MTAKKTMQLIDEIVQLSKTCDTETENKLLDFVKLFQEKEELNAKLDTQNKFFLKKWDKMNILMNEHSAQKDKMLEQHSRQAAMGEMIDAVAHQWKQPLNSISMMVDMIKYDFEEGLVTKEYIEEIQQDARTQIDYMVNTLNEFRNFLRPSTKDELFNLKSVVDNVQLLMKDELISQNISFDVTIKENINLIGNKNEFKHVFINIINNSIDAFNERETENRKISINSYTENSWIYIEIQDNAGGIPEEILDLIFKPNFTTKEEDKGTGIGLYMTEQILKKNHAEINVHNSTNGAFFTIKLRELTN